MEKKLGKARNFRGLTQKELGLKACISEAAVESTISQYERGVKAPKNNLLNRIADALEINSLYLRNDGVFSEEILLDLLSMEEPFNVQLT